MAFYTFAERFVNDGSEKKKKIFNENLLKRILTDPKFSDAVRREIQDYTLDGVIVDDAGVVGERTLRDVLQNTEQRLRRLEQQHDALLVATGSLHMWHQFESASNGEAVVPRTSADDRSPIPSLASVALEDQIEGSPVAAPVPTHADVAVQLLNGDKVLLSSKVIARLSFLSYIFSYGYNKSHHIYYSKS